MPPTILKKPPRPPDTPLPRAKAPGWFELAAQTLGGALGMPPLSAEDYDSPEGGQSIDRAGALGELLTLGGAGTLMAALKGAKTLPGTIGAAIGAKRIPNPIKAYHGSPHDFDQFSLSKIGTGEGAQAYGHGLYFAEAEGTAKSYRDQLARGDALTVRLPGQKPLQLEGIDNIGLDAAKFLEIGAKDAGQFPHNRVYYALKAADRAAENLPGAAKMNEQVKARIKEWADAKIGYEPIKGAVYEVNIHATPDELLDWDKPLSQQPAKVREAWEESYRRRYGRVPQLSRDISGAEAYNMLGAGSYVEADKALSPAIKGIQYLDQGSRTTGQVVNIHGKWYFSGSSQPFDTFEAATKAAEAMKPVTRNFVIRQDELIEIAKKYGIPLAMAASLVEAQGGTVQKR